MTFEQQEQKRIEAEFARVRNSISMMLVQTAYAGADKIYLANAIRRMADQLVQFAEAEA